MKFTVDNSFYKTIKGHMKQFENEGIITDEQKNAMLDSYSVKTSPTAISIATIIGAILIGVGIIAFIAGNWSVISPLMRITILLLSLIGTYVAGIKLENVSPKTAYALRLITLFIFGASLFLTDQTFNITRPIPELFLIFAFGTFIMTLAEKDKLLFYIFYEVFLSIIFISLIISSGVNATMSDLKIWSIALIAITGIIVAIYLLREISSTSWGYNMNTLSMGTAIIALCLKLAIEPLIITMIVFIYGILMISMVPRLLDEQFEIGLLNIPRPIGFLFFGISGMILTLQEVWIETLVYSWKLENIASIAPILSLIFTVIFFIYLLYLYKQEFIESILFIVAVIMRFYFDLFYSFMPKSLFFIIGGIILLTTGWYMEKKRRQKINSSTNSTDIRGKL